MRLFLSRKHLYTPDCFDTYLFEDVSVFSVYMCSCHISNLTRFLKETVFVRFRTEMLLRLFRSTGLFLAY